MAESLRDQLLKSGIVKQVTEQKRPSPQQGGKPPYKGSKPQGGGNKPQGARPPHKGHVPGKSQDEIDLARAYAIRAQTEAGERKRAEQEAAELARIKRERKQKIQQLLSGNVLNKADADQVRHFEYGGKIRRMHVDAAQLAALNAGELGVVQQAGRYLLVSREVAEQVRDLDAQQLALLVEPGATGVGDDGVPDDLMW
ncbi:DUF2058 domain-containing protein [Dyella tabacisoli]|uniref:DUF2058 domain-containing protein n=1 Tax=Dyella tabacisoli TaxID=2282381 RepID=A0A369URZ8_9GAMM|nr:DUF2058 family protein [Dyella tabacisoli]RDD83291.1 DUF2058 domain-containing protein [Dyella tabacisoli]